MPIEYRIDHEARIVVARGFGVITDSDVFGYQRTVWSRPDVAGFDELVDMRDVQTIVPPSSERVKQLAAVSAVMDAPGSPSKFAIVASDDLAFGLGRMYQSYRESNKNSTKEVAVFRTRDAALHWLGLSGTDDRAARP